jgi:hypothetical protein
LFCNKQRFISVRTSRFHADYKRRKASDRGKSEVFALLTSTLRQMKDSRQALLTVLVFYNGLERGFFDADFNKVPSSLSFESIPTAASR